MKFFVIIEILLIAATVGISFADVPDVVLWVAIAVTAVFGIIMFAFIFINLKNENKGKKDK